MLPVKGLRQCRYGVEAVFKIWLGKDLEIILKCILQECITLEGTDILRPETPEKALNNPYIGPVSAFSECAPDLRGLMRYAAHPGGF